MAKKVFIEVTSFYHAGFTTGIQRVVREVVTRLLKMPEFELVLFVYAARGGGALGQF